MPMADDRKEENSSEPSVEPDQQPQPGNTMPCLPQDTSNIQLVKTAAQFKYEAVMSQSQSTTLQLDVSVYPRELLSLAKKLIDQGEPSIAVVVAHTACEVATERKLSEAFAAISLDYVAAWLRDQLNGYNLANEKNRKLYVSLTGDDVHLTTFWSKFKKSAERRNNIIHEGLKVDKAAAEESYQAAQDLLLHLKI